MHTSCRYRHYAPLHLSLLFHGRRRGTSGIHRKIRDGSTGIYLERELDLLKIQIASCKWGTILEIWKWFSRLIVLLIILPFNIATKWDVSKNHLSSGSLHGCNSDCVTHMPIQLCINLSRTCMLSLRHYPPGYCYVSSELSLYILHVIYHDERDQSTFISCLDNYASSLLRYILTQPLRADQQAQDSS